MEQNVADVVNYFGGRKEMARQLGVTLPAIYYWLQRGWMPANQCIKVEQLSGGKFKATELFKS